MDPLINRRIYDISKNFKELKLSRVSILVLKTIVEISKNFKESSVLADTFE